MNNKKRILPHKMTAQTALKSVICSASNGKRSIQTQQRKMIHKESNARQTLYGQSGEYRDQ